MATAFVLCITLLNIKGQTSAPYSSTISDTAKLTTFPNTLLSNSFEKVKIPLIKKVNEKPFWILPSIAWNNYDKTQLGVLFGIERDEHYQVLISPMYGMGSGNLTGFMDASYFFGTPRIEQWTIGLQARRFSYLLFPEDLSYNTIKPSIHLTPNIKMKGSIRFGIKSTYAWQEYLLNGRQTQHFNFHNIDFDYSIEDEKFTVQSDFDFQFNRNYGLVKWTNQLTFPFASSPGNSAVVKTFVGGFLFNNSLSSNINPPLPIFQLSGLSNTGIYWLQKDYGFDDWYLDRNAQDNFLRKQVASSEGGFYSPTSIGNTNNFMAAINLKSDLSIPVRVKKWLNFQIFANSAVVKNQSMKATLYGEAGASIFFFNQLVGFHLPVVSSNNIKQNQQTIFNIGSRDWTQRISFSLDILRLKELAQNK